MAEKTELTDSQILAAARQFDGFKEVANGLREFVNIKQKIAGKKQESTNLDNEIAGKRKLLEEAILAHQTRLGELDTEFAMKKAAKERELEDYGAKLGAQIDELKTVVKTLEANALTAEKNVLERTKVAQAKQNEKLAAFATAEKQAMARNNVLDEEFKALTQSLDELKKKHGL